MGDKRVTKLRSALFRLVDRVEEYAHERMFDGPADDSDFTDKAAIKVDRAVANARKILAETAPMTKAKQESGG